MLLFSPIFNFFSFNLFMSKDRQGNKRKDGNKQQKRSPELSDETLEMGDGFTKQISGHRSQDKYPSKKLKKKNLPRKRTGLIGLLTYQISTRKAAVILGVIFILALGVIALDFYLSRLVATPSSHYAFPEYETNLDYPSPLTGVMTTEKRATRRVIGVMIENHPQSRPQSGLPEAGLVYEDLVEGGITRFLAFYLENDSNQIGPIRSARAYYLPWVEELDALYAHVGGSQQSFDLINKYNIKDLNQFYNSAAYWRDRSRYAPHNVYSTTKRLRQTGIDKEWEDKNSFISWKFQDAEKIPDNPISRISINFSGRLYAVKYRYLKKENSYQRYLAGQPHKDAKGKAIKPKNIIIQIMSQSLSNDHRHLAMDPVGSGTAYLFRDGRIFKGEWQKTNLQSRTKFYLPSGREFKFTRGQTWVHILPDSNNFSYSRE